MLLCSLSPGNAETKSYVLYMFLLILWGFLEGGKGICWGYGILNQAGEQTIISQTFRTVTNDSSELQVINPGGAIFN